MSTAGIVSKVNTWKYAETALGVFVAASGLAISLLNIRNLAKNKNSVSSILLSENLLMTGLGIAYIVRSQYELTLTNSEDNMREKSLQNFWNADQKTECNFKKILISYGPFIFSIVNSFISLIINNYIHYQIAEENCRIDEENTVRHINAGTVNSCNRAITFIKKNFKLFAALLQWTVPILIAASMYLIDVKEKVTMRLETSSDHHSCLSMLDMANMNCSIANDTSLRNYLHSEYLNVSDNLNNTSSEVQSVIENIYNIINSFKDRDISMKVTPENRNSKFIFNDKRCFTMCYVETKSLLIYMFGLIVVGCFVPIIISIVLYTKLRAMDTKLTVKSDVQKELFYNVLFWTPVTMDSFLSLILCSYDIESTHTTVMTIVANVYQVLKNLLNTKHYNGNNVIPA